MVFVVSNGLVFMSNYIQLSVVIGGQLWHILWLFNSDFLLL